MCLFVYCIYHISNTYSSMQKRIHCLHLICDECDDRYVNVIQTSSYVCARMCMFMCVFVSWNMFVWYLRIYTYLQGVTCGNKPDVFTLGRVECDIQSSAPLVDSPWSGRAVCMWERVRENIKMRATVRGSARARVRARARHKHRYRYTHTNTDIDIDADTDRKKKK